MKIIQLINLTSLRSQLKTYENEESMLIEEDVSDFVEVEEVKVMIGSYTSKMKQSMRQEAGLSIETLTQALEDNDEQLILDLLQSHPFSDLIFSFALHSNKTVEVYST